MTEKSPLSPALSAFRIWQAIEPSAVVEALPLDAAFEAFEHATAPGNNAATGIIGAQSIGLHIVACRLFELAADAQEDWPKFSGLLDLALRAQDQCRQSLESVHNLNRSNEHGQS